jgi:hypothetical protein
MKLTSSLYLQRARALADWFVANQVTRTHFADRGRFANQVRVRGRQEKTHLTTNWTTGMSTIALLMAWERTRDPRYLEAAKIAGGYLKSLQILDPRNPAAFGGFREETPQSNAFHPRDALSAAWGLLHLHRATGDDDGLWRAVTFANWLERHGMRRGYPAWTAYTEKGRTPYWQIGSFHGGSPLFFFDLYATTKNRRWLRTGLTICDAWLRHFPKPDGSIRIEIDADTGEDVTGKSKDPGHIGWQDMHKTNDDFTAQALLRAWRLTRNRRYLDGARAFLDWALTQQRADGAFGDPPVNSAAATLILELLDFARLARSPRHRQAALRSVPHFLSLQELAAKDPRFHGGFYCVHGDYVHAARVELGVRTSCYALAALLRLEGKRRYQGYTA